MGINYTTTAQWYFCNLHRYVLLVAQSEAAAKKRSKFAVGKQQASYMPSPAMRQPMAASAAAPATQPLIKIGCVLS